MESLHFEEGAQAQQEASNNNDSKRGGWVTFPFIIGLSLSLYYYTGLCSNLNSKFLSWSNIWICLN